MKNHRVARPFAAILTLVLTVSALTQSGGDFAITKSVVGGGGSAVAGGDFAVASTVGQSFAGSAPSGGAFAVTSGFWNFTVNPAAGTGIEGDVAARPAGDGIVASNDVVQTQRFQIGLDQAAQSNEFQRADTAPFASRGDGAIDSTDVVQTQRYLTGLSGTQPAAGPVDASGLVAAEPADAPKNFGPGRQLRIQNATSARGQQVVVNILADAAGDESAYGFRVTFNPAILTSPTTAIGTAGGSRLCNTSVAGQVTCSVNNFPNDQPGSSTDQIGEIAPGVGQLLARVTFTVAAGAPAGQTPVGLTNVNASNDAAAALAITAQGGGVTVIAPTAAAVSVAGRVATAEGAGIRNAVVTLTILATGETLTARTGSFGIYRFDSVRAGEACVLRVQSARFAFASDSRVLTPSEDVADADFAALPR